MILRLCGLDRYVLCGHVLSHTSAVTKLGRLILLGYNIDVASTSLGRDNKCMLIKVEDHTPQLSNKTEHSVISQQTKSTLMHDNFNLQI